MIYYVFKLILFISSFNCLVLGNCLMILYRMSNVYRYLQFMIRLFEVLCLCIKLIRILIYVLINEFCFLNFNLSFIEFYLLGCVFILEF